MMNSMLSCVLHFLLFQTTFRRTKRKKVHVISTSKRPVPLEHFIYTGNSSKTSKERFLVVGPTGKFDEIGYVNELVRVLCLQPHTMLWWLLLSAVKVYLEKRQVVARLISFMLSSGLQISWHLSVDGSFNCATFSI